MSLRALAIALTAGCEPQAPVEQTVEIVSEAPAQLTPDSLEVTPRIETVQDTPERGLVALSLTLQLLNRRQSVSVAVPRIGFRFWRDGAVAAPSSPAWHRPARYLRRGAGPDSLIPRVPFTYGLSISPSVVAEGNDEAVYRVEAYLVDAAGGERTVNVGRVRLRVPRAGDTGHPR